LPKINIQFRREALATLLCLRFRDVVTRPCWWHHMMSGIGWLAYSTLVYRSR